MTIGQAKDAISILAKTESEIRISFTSEAFGIVRATDLEWMAIGDAVNALDTADSTVRAIGGEITHVTVSRKPV